MREVRVSEEALVAAGATPELARAIANLGTIALRDSLRLAQLEGAYEVQFESLRKRVEDVENKNNS